VIAPINAHFNHTSTGLVGKTPPLLSSSATGFFFAGENSTTYSQMPNDLFLFG
jgi:hypothetical protein